LDKPEVSAIVKEITVQERRKLFDENKMKMQLKTTVNKTAAQWLENVANKLSGTFEYVSIVSEKKQRCKMHIAGNKKKASGQTSKANLDIVPPLGSIIPLSKFGETILIAWTIRFHLVICRPIHTST